LLVSVIQSQTNRDDIEAVEWDEIFPLGKPSKGKTIQTVYTPHVEYPRVDYNAVARIRRNTGGLSASSCALTR